MKRLRYLRRMRELSQTVVGNACDMSPATVCQIESGRVVPDTDELNALGKFFGVDPKTLLDEVQVP